MVTLPRKLLQVIIGLDCFLLVPVVDSMASQNPEDWEFLLAYLLDDPIQLSQPSTSKRRMRDEVKISERCVQLRSNLYLQQLLLTSLSSLQPDATVLIIILEVEAILIGGYQVVFKGCFQNTIEGQMMSHLSDDISYRLWLQGPLNHLGGEQRANYIAVILYKIQEFLYV
jgi:hypothetical protein